MTDPIDMSDLGPPTARERLLIATMQRSLGFIPAPEGADFVMPGLWATDTVDPDDPEGSKLDFFIDPVGLCVQTKVPPTLDYLAKANEFLLSIVTQVLAARKIPLEVTIQDTQPPRRPQG